jgi:hypothetical protein
MPAKKFQAEEIIGKLREAEVLLNQGVALEEVYRRIDERDLPPFLVPQSKLLS